MMEAHRSVVARVRVESKRRCISRKRGIAKLVLRKSTQKQRLRRESNDRHNTQNVILEVHRMYFGSVPAGRQCKCILGQCGIARAALRSPTPTQRMMLLSNAQNTKQNEGAKAAGLLGLGDHVQGQGRLAARLGAEDLDDPTPGQSPDAERQVEREGARRDGRDLGPVVVAHPHDGPLAELPLYLGDRGVYCLALIQCILHETRESIAFE